MHNTTNVSNALFTKKNETRFVEAFERLVDHITKTPMDERTVSWLESTMNAALGQKPSPESALIEHEHRIKQLEMELRAANAKLSNRL